MDRLKEKLKSISSKLLSISGETLKTIGKIIMYLKIGKISLIYIIEITKFPRDILLVRDIIRRLGKVTFDLIENKIFINKRIPHYNESNCFKILK